MRLQLLPIAMTVVLVAACNEERTPVDDRSPPAAEPADPTPPAASATPATPPPTSLPEPGESVDVPPAGTPDGKDGQATFNGFGDLRFGMAAADMEQAWGGALSERGKADNETCYFMAPTWAKAPAELSFMIGDGKFVRVGTQSASFVAPGGGRVGMRQAQIEALYPGRVEVQPHKYSDGKYLRIRDAAGGDGVLIFETDERGVVEAFRVGLPPHIDYVEGCA